MCPNGVAITPAFAITTSNGSYPPRANHPHTLSHTLQIREIQFHKLKTLDIRRRRARLLQIACGPHNLCAMRCQRSGRFYSQTSRHSRHQDPLALKIYSSQNIFCG